jgi:hypothetical protein
LPNAHQKANNVECSGDLCRSCTTTAAVFNYLGGAEKFEQALVAD